MTPEDLVAFAEGLSQVAAAGGGPKAFASYLAQALNATVLVEDAAEKHLATAGSGAIPAAIRESIDTRRAVARTLLHSRNGTPGVALPIYVGEAHLGWLAVFGADLARAAALIRLGASAIGVELARESGGAHGRRRTFWERIVSGGYQDAGAARDDAAARGIALCSSYVAVALEIDPSSGTNGADEYAQLRQTALETFRSAEADVALLESGASLRLLIPAPREVDAANIRTAATIFPRTLAKQSPSARIAGGVGERGSLLHAGISMQQAESAMSIARRLFGSGHVSLYDDLGAYPLLLEGAGTSQWAAFSARVLAALRSYDEKHQTELERTLGLYFSAGQNVKTTAAELNVHRHTVFYRLRQIAEICNCKLESPHDQLTLRLAIAIDALLKQPFERPGN